MREIRSDIDGKMHRLKLNYYDTHTHGDILSVITNDVDTINNTVSQNLTSIVTQVITAIGILLMMLAISPKLTIIPIIMVPLSLLSAAGVMKSSGRHYENSSSCWVSSTDTLKKCTTASRSFSHSAIRTGQSSVFPF